MEEVKIELIPIHKDTKGWWFWNAAWEERNGPYRQYAEALQAFEDYCDYQSKPVCADCKVPMKHLGTFKQTPQWLCVGCGWVSIGEGDTRWA